MTSTTQSPAPPPDLTIAPVAAATVLGTTAFTALGIYGDGSTGADEHGSGSSSSSSASPSSRPPSCSGSSSRGSRLLAKAAGVGLGLSIAGLVAGPRRSGRA